MPPPNHPLSEPISTYTTTAPFDLWSCLPFIVCLTVAALGLYYALKD